MTLEKFAKDKEVQQYRNLVEQPEEFSEGFGLKMIIGTLFMGFLMVPASLYLSLFIGESMGPAAKWVTVILFAEVAKRSMKNLSQQEIFVLFYMTGIVLINPQQLPLWRQYLVQSEAAISLGVAPEIPAWIAPSAETLARYETRTFLTWDWFVPFAVIFWSVIINRMESFGAGYALYRLTGHVEKLPFPMAPVGALSITALAEDRETRGGWRWRMFSLGGVLGMFFGLIYIGVPALTNTFFGVTVEILPIPWLDLGPALSTENFLPACPMNITFDMGMFILGMVLPFWAVMGGMIGLLITWIVNPFLYAGGYLPSWEPGMGVVDTLYNNNVDFFLSFNIGISFAIFFASMGPLLITFFSMRKRRAEDQEGEAITAQSIKEGLMKQDPKRGDMNFFIALGVYLFAVATYIILCSYLMPGDEEGRGRFPWEFFLAFSLLYQPIVGYVEAKLEGMVGQHVPVPLVKQASFILSGYSGAAMWFAPIPMDDNAASVRSFRVMELTGVRVSGVIKTNLVAIPMMFVCMVLFSELIYRLAPIPSEAYPFTQEVWELQARNLCLMVTATMEGSSEFMNALKPSYVMWGAGIGLFSFMLLNYLNLPVFLIYGAVRGLNQTSPGGLWMELLGAIVGRLYLERKLGTQKYKQYMAVVFAGFSAGVGLIGMVSVSIALIASSTKNVGY